MRRAYNLELAELERTFGAAYDGVLKEATALLASSQDRPMIFVGAGGSLTTAHVAAVLHEHYSGHPGRAMTPLEFATNAPLSGAVGLLHFSSRAAHPDAALVMSSARAGGLSPVALMTSRSEQELPPQVRQPAEVILTVPSPRDGFLATNSVLAMVRVLCEAYSQELPPDLPWLRHPVPELRTRLVVVTGATTRPIGIDLETRMAETGLGWTQVTDWRNLAHGRHVGLERNRHDLSLVAVVSLEDERLAARTLELIPETIERFVLESDRPFPYSIPDLLVGGMRLVGQLGQAASLDPGRPHVPDFGRRMYHLSVATIPRPSRGDPVERKIRASGLPSVTRPAYERALARWLDATQESLVTGIALDYDGTCCGTDQRYEPLTSDVVVRLINLLEGGVRLAFASGRGKSLHQSLRSALPTSFWDRVMVGMYNGSIRMSLSAEVGDYSAVDLRLSQLADNLEQVDIGIRLRVERRATQLTLAAEQGEVPGATLLPLVQSLIATGGHLDLKAYASAHSVDVMASATSKASIVRALEDEIGGEILAIGDRGHPGGNDFELLASTWLSLSVDSCSADPTRCWNLDTLGRRGPRLLTDYLDAVRLTTRGAHFDWSHYAG